ncbi:MAG: alpha/beta hydrolase [Rhodobacteraceae bacterium]|nr:MAG: alpha/beta hydrolase [Paracoccaceae bacterium]
MQWAAQPDAPLTVDGVDLEYACYGPAPDKAPTIIMLHEGLGCLALWRDFPQQVAEQTGMGVFVWSRQGYGQSAPADLPRPVDFMTHEAVDVLPKLLDHIGLRRGILFGHSDGATIAAIHAGSVADMRVRGLILMAPHFFTEPGGLAAIKSARDSFDTGDMQVRMGKYHRDPVATFHGWNDVWLSPGFRDWNVSDVIDYWRVPVLAIQGREDQYGTLAQIEEIEARITAPLDVEVLDNCRHAPHFEQPDRTLKAVVEFAARLERIESQVVVPC